MISLMRKDDFVTVRNRFGAEKFQMTLGERDSTATITVGPEAPEIIIGDILRDDDEPGKGIYWRVNKVDTDYKTDTRTISCNHVIYMLKEKILFGEQTTATICGRKGATSCTAKEAMRYVMSFQRDFELGDFPKGYESVTNAYSFNGDDLFSAMETISETLEDCWWEYDFRKYPFKLHIRDRRQANVETELRLSRNIQNAKLTVDRSTMYTRLFPIGKNDLQLSGTKYVSRHENLYGMICKTETNAEKETTSALKAWAQTQLKIHAEPTVTVTVTAMDLSQQTGEPMDHIMLGAICQMPLPGYGTTIKERINRMSWSDKIRDPNNIQVTMANTRATASSIVASSAKSSSKSSRVSATNTAKGVLDIDLRQNEKDKNKFTLWKEDYKGLWTDVGTFSRAVTSWSVSATGGTIKVTAKPQNQSKKVLVRAGEGTWEGNSFIGPIECSGDGGTTWIETGADYTIDGQDRYEAGWTAAYGKVELPKSEATNVNSILIKTPPATVDGAAVSTSYIMSSYDKNNVDLETLVEGDYVTVARMNHGKYNAGWAAAYDLVELPKEEKTNVTAIVIKTPGSTVDGNPTLTNYGMYLNGNNAVDLKVNVNGTMVTVARQTHGKYDEGWSAAADEVVEPAAGTGTSMYVLVPAGVAGSHTSLIYTLTIGQNYAKILDHNNETVAQIAQYYNQSGTLYYDSYEYTQGNFVYYYHQTISQQSQAIVSRGSRLVKWHA